MSVFMLKLIALITMVVDHSAAVFSEAVATPLLSDTLAYDLRALGRIAFPLYAFLLVEGFRHTRDWRKYALRLLGLGVLSQLPYAFTINGWIAFSGMPWWRRVTDLNILFTLALGVLLLAFLDTKRLTGLLHARGTAPALAVLAVLFYISTIETVAYALGLAAVLLFVARYDERLRPIAGQAARFALFGFVLFWCIGRSVISVDYDFNAIALFAALYWAKTPRRSAIVVAAWGVFMYAGSWFPIAYVLVAAVFVALYNGKKGKNDHRLFYWAYPAHLFVLWGVLAWLT